MSRHTLLMPGRRHSGKSDQETREKRVIDVRRPTCVFSKVFGSSSLKCTRKSFVSECDKKLFIGFHDKLTSVPLAETTCKLVLSSIKLVLFPSISILSAMTDKANPFQTVFLNST